MAQWDCTCSACMRHGVQAPALGKQQDGILKTYMRVKSGTDQATEHSKEGSKNREDTVLPFKKKSCGSVRF